jgi:hypothetical protein
MKPSSPSSGPSGALDCGTVHFRELLKLPASRRPPGGTRHMDSPALSVFRERFTSPFTHAMVVDGVERFVGSSEVSWGTQQIAGFKTSVERPWSIAPKETAEVMLAIAERGFDSSVKAGENSGEELHHWSVVRELKVLGTIGNGKEGFTAQPSVELDSKWNLENLCAVVFAREKKNRRILGAAAFRIRHGDFVAAKE